MALTKDLVNIHHGEIRINSDAVTGNTFVVWLPVDRSAYAEDEIDDSLQVTNSPLQPENEECADSQMVGELAVEQDVPALLLVEDNEDLLSIMTRLLSAHYRILTATQGQEAIGILEKEEVDLVVSDVMMPVMDGIELCNYIKNKFELCHIPVILLTAKRTEEACRLIDENKKIRIADLAYAVGFNDAKYFSTCFRKKFGVSPSDYMLRNKEDNEVSS